MPVVSNTSPLSNLAIIGRLAILKRRHGVILIPRAVEVELGALSHVGGANALAEAKLQGWLATRNVVAAPPKLQVALDPGEAQAIALAVEVQADVLLIDEKRGRSVARQFGIPVGGVLGELLHARRQGWIPNLRDEITRLRSEAGFFVGAEIEHFILSQAGE